MPEYRKTRPTRFLLVEDDADHADLIRRSLRDNNVANAIDHVDDGEKALAFLRRQGEYSTAHRPDVILLDLRLPRMNGHEVLESIKADPDLRAIPVVVLTTSRTEADISRAYAASANSYVVKPVDFTQFHKLVMDLKMYWTIWNERPD